MSLKKQKKAINKLITNAQQIDSLTHEEKVVVACNTIMRVLDAMETLGFKMIVDATEESTPLNDAYQNLKATAGVFLAKALDEFNGLNKGNENGSDNNDSKEA